MYYILYYKSLNLSSPKEDFEDFLKTLAFLTKILYNKAKNIFRSFAMELDRLLLRVKNPAWYSGGELNSVVKDKQSVKTRFAFCFPDLYDVAMSHLGIKILYDILLPNLFQWIFLITNINECDLNHSIFSVW